jgi:hypothetical protein
MANCDIKEVDMISEIIGTACNRAAKGRTVILGYQRPEDGKIGVPIPTYLPKNARDCVVALPDFFGALEKMFNGAPAGVTNHGEMKVGKFIDSVISEPEKRNFFNGTCLLPNSKRGVLKASYDPENGHRWLVVGGEK